MKHPGIHALALGGCLCLLYSGYELARASSLALFNRNGAAGVGGAVSATLSFVLSIATLQLYGVGAEAVGAKWTLLLSAGACCAVFLAFAVACFEMDAISPTVVAGLFAFRETYVALIGTQVWGLLSSALKRRGPQESRRWFCIIQGVSCICSAFSGVAAGRLATAGGQPYLLLATSLSLGIITATVGLTLTRTLPGAALGRGKSGWEGGGKGTGRESGGKKGGLLSVLRSSLALFRRSPLLAALLAEAMVCQVLTAILNVSFNEAIRESLVPERSLASAEPEARAAGFVGKSFAFIGLLSGVLQLVVMPWAMVRVDPPLLLRALPLVGGCGFLATLVSPGFRTATVAFAVSKILEYSVRGTALELVYQPMDDEERLLGKEAIATVGVRIGRTTAHVVLYLCSALLGGAPPQRVLMGVALAAAAVWAVTLRKVEALAGGDGTSRSSLPPRPPSGREDVVRSTPRGSLGLGGGGVVSGARIGGEVLGGVDGLRRRETQGEVGNGGGSSSSVVSAALGGRGNGTVRTNGSKRKGV